MEPRAKIGRNWTHVSVAPPLIKLIDYELREDAVVGEGSRQWQTHKCTHIHTVSFVIHRVYGASGKVRTQS